MQQCKRCSKCGETKPTDQFGKHKAWNDGLFPQCRECKRSSDRESYKRHRDERAAQKAGAYRSNPEPYKARAARRYAEKPDEVLAGIQEWRRNNPDKVRKYGATWTQRNLDGAVRENVRRRYARRKGAPTIVFSKAQLEQRMSMFGNRCWICSGPREAVDHVKPLSKGGSHMLCNLRPICASCNSRKRDTWPFGLLRSR